MGSQAWTATGSASTRRRRRAPLGELRTRARHLLVGQHSSFGRVYGRVRLQQASFVAGRSRPVVRRLDVHLLVSVALEHLRGGRLGEALGVLQRAAALDPGNERVQRFRRQAAGDLHVLSGAWRAPDLGRRAPLTPVRGRVLHVVGKSLPHESGYTLRTASVLRCQRAAGLDPHVTTDSDFAHAVAGVLGHGTEVVDGTAHHRIDGGRDRPGGLDSRLDRRVTLGAPVVEQVRPSVLHAASDFLNAEAALAWGRCFDIPVVYEVRGFWGETWLSGARGPDAERSDVYLGRRARELACMRSADAVVTLGEAMRREIVDQGVDADRVVVVPNAVDVDRFSPGRRPDRLAARLGVASGDVVLGHVTSITPYEGLDHLLEAIALLRRGHRPVRAVIVGDGPQRHALEVSSRRLGIADRVTFTGWVPHTDIVEYYRLIDVFVVPRVPARVCELVTPLKPYEAMATGRPVVAADVAALAEMVHHGRTGLLFRAGSSADLADALDSLVASRTERERLGAAARAWVTEHRTWEQNGCRYLDLYDRLGAT